MRGSFVLLLALAFLPTLCLADSINDVTNWQINTTATWIEANPACVSNCTETMNLSYEFESNPNPTANGIFGWVPMDTLQVTAFGFLGAFTPDPYAPALWEDDHMPGADSIPFFNADNAQRDEIDVGFLGPGVSGDWNGGPRVFIYDCFSDDCVAAYSANPYVIADNYIVANSIVSTAVKMPDYDSAWQLLLISAIACTFGFFVKHRLRPDSEQIDLQTTKVRSL